jgi:hypothetical protein
MSTLFELKDEILRGRRVRRILSIEAGYRDAEWFLDNSPFALFADDYLLEPLPEPKEKKKIKLYAYWYAGDNSIRISLHNMYGVTNYHSLPNLDQEIEVDE